MRTTMSDIKERIRQALAEGSLSHDRYMRSHGKKASGRGNWMFTTRGYGDPAKTEIFTFNGLLSDASKEAKAWAKKHGFHTVYVMEETEVEMEEGFTLKKASEIRNTIAADPDNWVPEIKEKEREYLIINNKTNKIVGRARYTNDDYFRNGDLDVDIKDGKGIRTVKMGGKKGQDPQAAFNRFMKSKDLPQRFKKILEETE